METAYSPTTRQETVIHVRVRKEQKDKLEEFAMNYHSSVSAILREAITVWLNLNSRGVK